MAIQAVRNTMVVEKFLDRAENLTNAVEDVCDMALQEHYGHVRAASLRASDAIVGHIAELPPHVEEEMATKGWIDVETPHGRGKRDKFLRSMNRVYRDWERDILRRSGLYKWASDKPMYSRSLGTIKHRTPPFISRWTPFVYALGHAMRATYQIPRIEMIQEEKKKSKEFRSKYGISISGNKKKAGLEEIYILC